MFFDLQYKLFNCEKFEINLLDNLTFHATTFSIILQFPKMDPEYRENLSPLHFEEQLFLYANSELWSVDTANAIIDDE